MTIIVRGHSIKVNFSLIVTKFYRERTSYNRHEDIRKVMGRGRPGGNPDFGTKYAFRTNRKEPLTKKITVRISENMDTQLKEIEDYREFIREAITKALVERKATSSEAMADN